MAAINFPTSPSDQQEHTENGLTYQYWSNTTAWITKPYSANTLVNNVTSLIQTGFTAKPVDAGTKSSGTYTPDPTLGGFQYAINNGAHTLAPPAANCTITVCYYNQSAAGVITTSGFTMVTGDDFTTTNQHEFICYITKTHNNGNNFSHLHVTALQ